MKKPSSVIIAILLLFSGCVDRRENSMASDSSATAPNSSNSIASRDFLFEDMLPREGYGAYGYLLFTKRPDSSSRNRFIKVASAYLAILEHTDSFSTVPLRELMPTYWFLKMEAFGSTPSAESLIEFYDYPRAKILLHHIEKNASEGPILVAWQKPFETEGEMGDALIFDLSTFSDEDMERAIQIWTSRIVKDPNLWNDGFKLVKFREEFRNFLQQYGEQVLAVITPGE